MSKKTKTKSQSTQVTTPNNPTWVSKGLEDVGGSLSTILGRNPLDFVAGASPLQMKSWEAAGNLKPSEDFGTARTIFNNVAGAGANTYDSTGYDATDAASSGYDATDWTGQGYDATNATSRGYDAQDYTGEGYDATTGSAANYDAIMARAAKGYDATNATASTYNASSLLEGLDKYMSPYTGQVVDAALQDYDYGAGQTRASQALDEARSGAFGGSGAAIGRSMTEGELARGRGSLSANLRDQGFTRGAGLSAQDAGFRNDASRFNADTQTRVSMSNADAANQANQFNAGETNRFSLADALAANDAARFNTGETNRFGIANMDAKNSAAAFGANARNTASASNADAANRFGLANMDATNTASAFGANARNTSAAANAAARNDASRFGADSSNRADLANAAARNDASRFGADASNRADLANADARNSASRFGADARNTSAASNAAARNDAARFGADAGNRANLANADARNTASRFGADARNTSAASNADARNTALRFGADAGNRATLANAAARNDASRFGADAKNTAGRYNAGAADAALDRRLTAGNSLASLGSTMGADSRANVALLNALGGDQRQVDQFLKSAPLDVLERIAKMYGGLPLNLLSGSTTTGSSSGTSKTYDPMGTLATLLGAGGTAAEGTAKLIAASDRRLKTDIERIGEREDGLGVYVYRYLWSPVRFIGVMAQEVLKVKPEAVIYMPNGFMAVNYGAL